jgi:uncharacterized membrane-anchored protein YitT (DUF2179 family)
MDIEYEGKKKRARARKVPSGVAYVLAGGVVVGLGVCLGFALRGASGGELAQVGAGIASKGVRMIK